MNQRLRKILEGSLLVFVGVVSIAIFVFRDKIDTVSNISYLGVFSLCFLANATVLLPAPSLLVAASCALIMNPFLVALFASLGSTCGELLGYTVGSVSKDLSPGFQKILNKITDKIHKPWLLVFILAALPLPLFDVAGIYSGGTKMNLFKFFAICFLGKFIKMLAYTRMYDVLGWLATFTNLQEFV